MLDQLIVLGQIPGTQIQLNFVQVMLAGMTIALAVWARHEYRKTQVQTKQEQQKA